jgi:hypothetical protein
MTQIEIIATKIRSLEFDLNRLKLERESILSIPDKNINGFTNPTKKSAQIRVNRKIRLHKASIELHYEMMKKAYNA